MRRLILSLITAIVLLPTVAMAGQVYGTLTFGPRNTRLESMEVRLLDQSDRVVDRVKTDSKGFYALTAPRGSYVIKVFYRDKMRGDCPVAVSDGGYRADLHLSYENKSFTLERK